MKRAYVVAAVCVAVGMAFGAFGADEVKYRTVAVHHAAERAISPAVVADGQLDLAGAKRVSGKIVDIGCYERVTTGLILFFQWRAPDCSRCRTRSRSGHMRLAAESGFEIITDK